MDNGSVCVLEFLGENFWEERKKALILCCWPHALMHMCKEQEVAASATKSHPRTTTRHPHLHPVRQHTHDTRRPARAKRPLCLFFLHTGRGRKTCLHKKKVVGRDRNTCARDRRSLPLQQRTTHGPLRTTLTL